MPKDLNQMRNRLEILRNQYARVAPEGLNLNFPEQQKRDNLFIEIQNLHSEIIDEELKQHKERKIKRGQPIDKTVNP